MYIICIEDKTNKILKEDFISEEMCQSEMIDTVRVLKKKSMFGTENFNIWVYDTSDDTTELWSDYDFH